MFHIYHRKINPKFLYLPSIFCVLHNVQDPLNTSNLHLYWKTRCHRLLNLRLRENKCLFLQPTKILHIYLYHVLYDLVIQNNLYWYMTHDRMSHGIKNKIVQYISPYIPIRETESVTKTRAVTGLIKHIYCFSCLSLSGILQISDMSHAT